MESKQSSELRKAVEECRKSGLKRYPAKIKSLVREIVKGGVRPSEVARQTGICKATIFSWATVKSDSFRSLKVKDKVSAEMKTMKIVFPNGILIECNSTDILKEILRIAG